MEYCVVCGDMAEDTSDFCDGGCEQHHKNITADTEFVMIRLVESRPLQYAGNIRRMGKARSKPRR